MTTTFKDFHFHDDLNHVLAAYEDFCRDYLEGEIRRDLLPGAAPEKDSEDNAAT